MTAPPITVLMVDVDGVIIRDPEGRRWDCDLEADLGLSPDDLQTHFFARHWRDLIVGRADLRTRLAAALPEFAPHLTADRLIEYWFARDSALDQTLLGELGELRAAGVALHLATDQEHLRAVYLWTTLDLQGRFDAMHYAAALGAGKPSPAFFAAATARAGADPREIGFIDDRSANIDAARAAGWRGHVWRPGLTLADALAAMQE